MNTRISVRALRVVALGSVIALTAAAGATAPKPAINKTADGVAVKGYDVVAYAVAGSAIKGSPQFQSTWNDAIWMFASADHRDRFVRAPEKYAPRFGGYCAWAVSRNYTADADPEAWRIVDGRLYLNYSKSVQRRWEEDVPGNIARAQANWPGVLDK